MRHLLTTAATLALVIGAFLAADRGEAHEEPLLVGAAPSEAPRVREVLVDLEPFGGASGVRRLRYDLDAVERALDVDDYAREPAWVVAVRLLLSEVGPDRLVNTEHGMAEAIGVLHTVRNRLDPRAANPEGVPGLAPWPGCGEGGTFHTCANPQQYRGLNQRQARTPAAAIRDVAVREAALDVAVAAWWLVFRADVADPSAGATSFVHRCGGAAYGKPVSACDGNPEVPDVPGARATTGPIEFRGPGAFDRSQGRYRLVTKARLDFVPLADGDAIVGLVGPEPVDDGEARATPE